MNLLRHRRVCKKGHFNVRVWTVGHPSRLWTLSREGATHNCRVFPKTEFLAPGSPTDVIEITRAGLAINFQHQFLQLVFHVPDCPQTNINFEKLRLTLRWTSEIRIRLSRAGGVPRYTTGPKLCDGQNSSSELIFILSKGFILTRFGSLVVKQFM